MVAPAGTWAVKRRAPAGLRCTKSQNATQPGVPVTAAMRLTLVTK